MLSRTRMALRAIGNKERTQVVTGEPRTNGIPCAMVYGLLRALPGVRAFLVTVACELVVRKLDLGIGRPGPRGFAIRDGQAFV